MANTDTDDDFVGIDDDFEATLDDGFEEVPTEDVAVTPEPATQLPLEAPVKTPAKSKVKTTDTPSRAAQRAKLAERKAEDESKASKSKAAKETSKPATQRSTKAKPAGTKTTNAKTGASTKVKQSPAKAANAKTETTVPAAGRRGRPPVKVPRGHSTIGILSERLSANPQLLRSFVRNDLGIESMRGVPIVLDKEQTAQVTALYKEKLKVTGGTPGRPKGHRLVPEGKYGVRDVATETGCRTAVAYAAVAECGFKPKARGNGAVYELTQSQFDRAVKKVKAGGVKVPHDSRKRAEKTPTTKTGTAKKTAAATKAKAKTTSKPAAKTGVTKTKAVGDAAQAKRERDAKAKRDKRAAAKKAAVA